MAPAYVKDTGLKTASNFNGATDQTGSFATLPAVGNHVFVGISLWSGTNVPGINVPTDNQSNTYAENIELKNEDLIGSRNSATIDSCKVATSAGTYTISVNVENNAASGNYMEWSAVELSGLDATTHLDQSGSGKSATGDALATASSVNTTDAGVALSVATINNSDTDINISDTPPSGYTNIQYNEDASATIGYDFVYKIYSASETSAAQFTHDNTSQSNWTAVIATYKAAAGAATRKFQRASVLGV